jgi:hypothetical protein
MTTTESVTANRDRLIGMLFGFFPAQMLQTVARLDGDTATLTPDGALLRRGEPGSVGRPAKLLLSVTTRSSPTRSPRRWPRAPARPHPPSSTTRI